VIGRTYLERGQPVVVQVAWNRPAAAGPGGAVDWLRPPRVTGPRNVLIRRVGGALIVRPFRGLRLPPPPEIPPGSRSSVQGDRPRG
jgi:hypothetical protein